MSPEQAAQHFGTSVESARELKKLTPQAVKEMVQVIRDVGEKLGEKVPLPEALTLVALFQSGSGASYEDYIVVPYQKFREGEKSRRYTKHPTYTRAILAHEYGHQIIDKYVAKRFPDLEKWKTEAAADAKKKGQEFEALLSEFEALKKKETLSPEERVRKDALSSELETAARVLLARASNGMTLDRPLTVAYSEIFADLVAVVSQGDPQAMTKAVELGPLSRGRGKETSFIEPSFPETWTETEEHAVLTPTRHFLWKEYLSRPEYRERGAEVARALMESIAQECEFRFVNRRYDMSPREMNERLIERLRLQLGSGAD